MGSFLSTLNKEDNLVEKIENIIWTAEKKLMIVSPFIKLDDHFEKIFEKLISKPNLQITIVFGKNENNFLKSFKSNDLDFFKKFPNLSILYSKDLHAKYYGNEKEGIITSINLVGYSFDNNIEFGVHYKQNILNKINKNADSDAWDTCWNIAREKSDVIFIKRPVFKKKLLSKEYVKSVVLHDFSDTRSNLNNEIILDDFKDFLEEKDIMNEKPTRAVVSKEKHNDKTGYCIRTGKSIPLNIDKPFSKNAFKKWDLYRDVEYPEKYCHFSGEKSFGNTCFSFPILEKNFKKYLKLIENESR